MRIGIKVPNTGDVPRKMGIGPISAMLESVGFDSLWVSDHIIMPRSVDSDYPFAEDRRVNWSTDVDWYDAVISMAQMMSATRRARIGVAVLVLPLRNPIEFAKQIASIEAQAGAGRLQLGIGTGWMKEEFDALDVPFATRGKRTDEWVEIAKECWSGYPKAFDGVHHQIPEGMVTRPSLEAPPPFLVGGQSTVALRRAAKIGEGWLGHYDASEVDIDEISATVQRLHDAAGGHYSADIVLRIVGTERGDSLNRLIAMLPQLRNLGVNEIIVDVDWVSSPEDKAKRLLAMIRDALAS